MKRKIVSFIACACVLGTSVVGFTACNKYAGEHVHEWDDGVVTTQPKCDEEGVKTYTCKIENCGETRTESVGTVAHTYDGGVVTTQPKCDEAGVKTFTCSACGDTYTQPVEKTEHIYDGGTLTKIPNIKEKGEITYTCTGCGATKTQTADERDDFGEQFYTDMANANAWGYGYATNFDAQTGTFEYTQLTQTDETYPNVWKAENVEISADKIVSVGNAVISYGIAEDMKLSFSASFTGDEETTRVAAYVAVASDGQLKGEVVTISGDSKDWTYKTEKGLEVEAGDILFIIFGNAGDGAPSGAFNFTVTAEPPCDHSWDDGVETKQPSCTEFGETTYTCGSCGATKTEPIDKTEHDFTGEWIKADDDGHHHKCKNCEATDTKVNHDWKETGRQEPVGETDGYVDYECGDCNATKREILTAEHQHSWTEESITKQPTFFEDGEKTLTCVCGESTTEAIPAKTTADFASEFYTDLQTESPWKYGLTDHMFDEQPLEFKQATEYNGEAWTMDGIKVGNGSITAYAAASVTYTFEKDVTVNIHVGFTGIDDNTLLALRIYAPDENGDMKEVLFNNEATKNIDKEYSFKTGQSVYITFSNEKWNDENSDPSGNLSITITKK